MQKAEALGLDVSLLIDQHTPENKEFTYQGRRLFINAGTKSYSWVKAALLTRKTIPGPVLILYGEKWQVRLQPSGGSDMWERKVSGEPNLSSGEALGIFLDSWGVSLSRFGSTAWLS